MIPQPLSYPHPCLFSYSDKLTESALGPSKDLSASYRRNNHDDNASPKVRFNTTESSRQAKGTTSGKKRRTPKKYVFFSEYLKDYNPALSQGASFLSPVSHQTQYEINERKFSTSALDRSKVDTTRTSPRLRASPRKVDYLQPPSNPYAGSSFGAGTTYARPSASPNRDSHRSNDSVREKKNRTKDDIRKKLSSLSGKLYSPMKSPSGGLDTSKDNFEDSVIRSRKVHVNTTANYDYSSSFLNT